MNGGDLVLRNLQLREQLRATSYRFKKFLGTFTTPTGAAALGSVTRIKLYNVGLITRLIIRVRAAVDIASGADAVLSAKGPFNLLRNIKITDYDGTDRINTTGQHLWVVNSVRRRTAWGYNNESQANVIANPDVNLVNNTTAGRLDFFLDIPLAYDETDLRGLLLAQTAVGEVYLTLTMNTALQTAGNVDAVFTAGAAATINGVINIDVWQEYIYPRSLEFVPPLDASTVYELIGNIDSSDNLAAGTEKLISLPNLRSIIGYYFNYINGTAMTAGGTDVDDIRLIVNGNNIMEADTGISHLFKQREYLNSDLRPGMYWKQWRDRPIETQYFGNVQIGFTPDTAAANSKLELGVESFYAKGLALPGVPQGA